MDKTCLFQVINPVFQSLTAVFSKTCFLHLEKAYLSNYAIQIRF